MDRLELKGLFYASYVNSVLYVVVVLWIYGDTNKHKRAV